MSVCICLIDIKYQTNFLLNLAFICYILPLPLSCTVLQYLNHYEPSHPSRRTSIPSKPVGRDAVLYVRLYVLRWHIISHKFLNYPRPHLFYFTDWNKLSPIAVSQQLLIIKAVKEVYNTISASSPWYGLHVGLYMLSWHIISHKFSN